MCVELAEEVLLRNRVHVGRVASLDGVALDALLLRDAPAIVDTVPPLARAHPTVMYDVHQADLVLDLYHGG